MKIGKKIVKGILLVIAICLFLLSLSTVVPQIPILGSIANHITVHYAHIYLPVSLALLALGVLCLCLRRNVSSVLLVVLLAANLILDATAYSISFTQFKKQGGDATFLSGYSPQDYSAVQTKTLTYTSSLYGDVELNVYYTQEGINKPVVVYIHGGGWIGGSKTDLEYQSKAFAQNGFVTVSVDYTLSTEDRHLSDQTELQLCHAFAWVKKNISSYNGDAEKLFVCGDSAGGNLALEMSYKINAGIYRTADGVELPQVRAVRATYPVADPAMFYNNKDIVIGAAARKMASYYTGTTPDEDPEAYERITPKIFLTDNTPPTMLILADNDSTVQPQGSLELAKALTDRGIENVVLTVPFANHSFDSVPGNYGSDGVISATIAFFSAKCNIE